MGASVTNNKKYFQLFMDRTEKDGHLDPPEAA
jgi:hypothetical protein